MKQLISLCVFVSAFGGLKAQYTYTIKADSVKLTNCDSSELIIENHTQTVHGFLFNTNNGRTIFKRGAEKLNDSLYLIGADTVKVKTNAWTQGGNSFNSTGVFGTMDNNHLDFYSNSTQQMRLANTGNLLVGTTTDEGYKLNVNGQIKLDNGTGTSIITAPTNFLEVTSTGVDLNTSVVRQFNGDLSHLYFSASTSSGLFTNRSGPFLLDVSGGTSFLRIHEYGDGSGITEIANLGSGLYPYLNINSPIQFNSATPVLGYNFLFVAKGSGGQSFAIQDSTLRNKFSINKPSGDVLINKDIPHGDIDDGHTFQVKGSSSFTDSVIMHNIPAGSVQDSVLVWNAISHAIHKVAQSSITFNGVLNSSLAVNGPITAQKLTLSAHDWPDYVFDSAYHLPSPDSLRRYIKQNNHLPETPSAFEADRKGVDVGDNQKLLLKKVEELTLYMLKQEERIQNLEQQIQQQNRTIDKLKTSR